MSSPTTSSAAASAPSQDLGPIAIEAIGLSKKYELQRHRTLLLKDAAKLALGKAEREVFWALRDVSFTVRKGEAVGFIGANGAGKSTLLSIVARTAFPTRGSIKVVGRVSALLELGAGFHPDFTGRENIFVNGTIMGLTREQIEARLDEIVEFSELGRFIDEPVRNYSSGMLARLGFSVASSVDPDILIVDEALAVGDQAFQEKCFARIADFKKRGCTILLVSHSLDMVKKLCERAFLLSHGQLLNVGRAKDVTRDYLDRAAHHQLEAAISPYETEQVPIRHRAAAALALLGLLGGIGYAGAKVVLTRDAPEQRPQAPAKALSIGK
jgi:ABC-type polysaccharide/polyol phosphate transport system ATPase subunit